MHSPGDFYDVKTDEAAQFQLEHTGGKEFKLLRRFGYVDLMPPHDHFQVPRDLVGFRTDLASTPQYFTWLIPGIGVHLPAILLHDGLVYDKNQKPSYIGPSIERHEADRIFRDAMKALGTGPIRRWMIWAASALATAWEERLAWKALLIGTFLLMFTLGALATLDLLDVVAIYPWMGDQAWYWEIIGGGVAGPRRSLHRLNPLGSQALRRDAHREHRLRVPHPRHDRDRGAYCCSTGCSSASPPAIEGGTRARQKSPAPPAVYAQRKIKSVS